MFWYIHYCVFVLAVRNYRQSFICVLLKNCDCEVFVILVCGIYKVAKFRYWLQRHLWAVIFKYLNYLNCYCQNVLLACVVFEIRLCGKQIVAKFRYWLQLHLWAILNLLGIRTISILLGLIVSYFKGAGLFQRAYQTMKQAGGRGTFYRQWRSYAQKGSPFDLNIPHPCGVMIRSHFGTIEP